MPPVVTIITGLLIAGVWIAGAMAVLIHFNRSRP